MTSESSRSLPIWRSGSATFSISTPELPSDSWDAQRAAHDCLAIEFIRAKCVTGSRGYDALGTGISEPDHAQARVGLKYMRRWVIEHTYAGAIAASPNSLSVPHARSWSLRRCVRLSRRFIIPSPCRAEGPDFMCDVMPLIAEPREFLARGGLPSRLDGTALRERKEFRPSITEAMDGMPSHIGIETGTFTPFE